MLNLLNLAVNGKVLLEINGGVYGLPQAGFAQETLVARLAEHGYHMTSTSYLFRHETQNIQFTLIVDDFSVKFTDDAGLHHLMTALQSTYEFM